jgi:hypothetical protein
VGRDVVTRRLQFFKLIEEIKEGVKTGNQYWVRFDALSGELLNASNEGRGNETGTMNEHIMIVPLGPQPIQGRATNGNNSMNMMVHNNSYLGPKNNQSQLLLVGGSSAESSGAAPKKRPRNDTDMLTKEGVITSKAPSNEVMQVEEVISTTMVAEADIIMQQNPLFDVNNVMAGPDYQACQKK